MRDAEHLDGDTLRGGPPGQIADAYGGSRQYVRADSLVGGDVQAVRRGQRQGDLGVGGYPGHRGRPAGTAAQHLAALGHQPRRLRPGQAARPGQSGNLAQAVAHRGARRDAQLVQRAQRRERGRQHGRMGEPRSGQPAEHHHHPARRPHRDVHALIARGRQLSPCALAAAVPRPAAVPWPAAAAGPPVLSSRAASRARATSWPGVPAVSAARTGPAPLPARSTPQASCLASSRSSASPISPAPAAMTSSRSASPTGSSPHSPNTLSCPGAPG